MPDELTTTQTTELVPIDGQARLTTQAMRGKPDIDQMIREAEMMSHSSLIPDHLVWAKDPGRTAGNCFRIVRQAYSWGIDPFTLADESYVLKGRLAYSGKLIAAIVNTRAGLKERLKATFKGTGDNREVTISGTFTKSKVPNEITLTVGQAKTKNEMWKNDPDQKLFYSGVIKWARRFCPELVLGVSVADEIEALPATFSQVEDTTDETGADEIEPAPETPAVVPTLAKGEEARQTLQEALATAQQPLKGDDLFAPDAKCNHSLLLRLNDARELFFTAKGIGKQPEDEETRKNAWAMLLKKYDVTTAKALTNAQALELEGRLNDATYKAHEAKKAAQEKK